VSSGCVRIWNSRSKSHRCASLQHVRDAAIFIIRSMLLAALLPQATSASHVTSVGPIQASCNGLRRGVGRLTHRDRATARRIDNLTLQQQFRRLGRHPRGFYQQQPDIVQDKLGIPTVSRESKEDAIIQMARKGPGEHTPQHPPSSKAFSLEKSPKEKIPGVCSTKIKTD
jgi:hypothetical protein